MTRTSTIAVAPGSSSPAWAADPRRRRRSTRSGRRSSPAARHRGPIQRFDPSRAPGALRGARSSTSTRSPYLGPKESRRVDRATQLGFAAAADALADAGDLGVDPGRCAVIAATGIGGLDHARGTGHVYLEKGAEPGQPVLRPDDDGRTRPPGSSASTSAGPAPTSASPPRARPAPTRSARARASSATASPTSSMAGGTEAAITPPGRRRVRPHGRAEQAQRRAGARVTPVRRRPRRLRDGRGRRHARARALDRARRTGRHASTARSPATAATATRTTSPRRRRVARARPRACSSRSTTPGSTPATSAT